MSNLTSTLHTTAPDTIYLNFGNDEDILAKPYDAEYATFNASWHADDGSSSKLDPVHIEYRKVTPNDRKLVLQASWTKTERVNYTTYRCVISDMFSAEITEFPGDEPPRWIVCLPLVSDSCSTDFNSGTKARAFVVASLAEFVHDLSPNIIIIHDDTLPEFK